MTSSSKAFVGKYLAKVCKVLQSIDADAVVATIEMVEAAMHEGRTVFLAGNGGSAATASHMANDLLKTAAKKHGRGVRVVALSDNVPLLTAIGNDVSFEEIFSGQLESLARSGDVLVVISGSGNSPNILRSITVAKSIGVRTIGFLGMDGGKAKAMVDVAVVVPSDDYGPIEDAHVVLNHLITEYLRELP